MQHVSIPSNRGSHSNRELWMKEEELEWAVSIPSNRGSHSNKGNTMSAYPNMIKSLNPLESGQSFECGKIKVGRKGQVIVSIPSNRGSHSNKSSQSPNSGRRENCLNPLESGQSFE